MNEEKGDEIYLNDQQLKLFNLLKRNSSSESSWLSSKDLSRKLGVPEEKAKKIISSLKKTEGINLASITKKESSGNKTTRYGLSPETLEVLVKPGNTAPSKSDYNYFSLYLGKPAFGTKAFDEKYTMKGLALALEVNGLSKEIREVDIQGGIIPMVPPYSSVSYLTALKFLGKVDRKDNKKGSAEKMLEEEIETEFERKFYHEFINNTKSKKITTLTEAFQESEKQISTLMNSLPSETTLRMQLGFEERENIRFLEQAMIQEIADKKTKRIKAMKEDFFADNYEIHQNSYKLFLMEDILNKFSENKTLLRKEKESKKEYFERVQSKFVKKEENEGEDRYLERLKKEISKQFKESKEKTENLWEGYRTYNPSSFEKENLEVLEEVMKYSFYWSYRDSKKIGLKLKQISSEIENLPKKRRNLESRMEDLESMDSWTKTLLSGDRSSITRFTRQYPVDADSVELTWKKTKDKFTKHFFDWEIPNPMVVHVSPRKKVTIDTGVVMDVLTGEKDKVELDYSVQFDGKKKIMMIENINHIFSNDVSANSIKSAKTLLNYETMVLKKVYEKEIKSVQPDIVLLGAHMTGGFRAMPWFKESDQYIEGKFESPSEISWMVALPTMQSIPRLEWLTSKNFRNWNVKEYQKGPYASAAIVHAEDKEGVPKFWIMSNSYLNQAGIFAEEIETYRNELKKEKNPEIRKNLTNLIKETRNKVKANFETIEAGGDFHLGAPDIPERYSKDQWIKAAQSYQKRHGLPKIVAYDELLHGVEERIFKSGARYEGKIPQQFEREFLIPTMNNPNLSDFEKIKLIAKESLNNLRAITMHNEAHQKDVFDWLIKPYLNVILDEKGKVIFTSGNHYNQSQKLSDEAQELVGRFDKSLVHDKYNPNGKIYAHSGRGNPVGVGTIILPGEANQKLFTMHKFPQKRDEGYGALLNLESGKNDSDIIIYGDRHQPIISFANEQLAVLHPGMEPINKYVPLIGKPAGIHGINNILYDPNKRGIYRVDSILDRTLEKIIKTEDII